MELTPELKAEIDAKTYEELLRSWRFNPAGSPIFQGESGQYYSRRMAEQKAAHPDPVAASKAVGWGD